MSLPSSPTAFRRRISCRPSRRCALDSLARSSWTGLLDSMNLIGLKTLFLKEVRRFLRVPGQTVLSPLVSTALYFVVFGYSLGGRAREVAGVPYIVFIVPGLIFLGIANNAFLNTSSSLFIHKIQGTV